MEKLLKRAKMNDKNAFNEIITIIQKRLYIIAKSRLNSEEDVYDVMQETLIKAYNSLKSLEDDNKFNSWITSILINNCNTLLKQNIISKTIPYEETDMENLIYEDDDIKINQDVDFFSLTDNLDVEEKTLLTMFYSEEYTSKEISEILHINENTIRSKISRAKCKIKEKYKKEDFYERKA
ncbi:MAG: RNA polymerase sigma factor [Clostridia bacterium]|nr:RNA polymerase sigma factor [Clostridia bacterium]